MLDNTKYNLNEKLTNLDKSKEKHTDVVNEYRLTNFTETNAVINDYHAGKVKILDQSTRENYVRYKNTAGTNLIGKIAAFNVSYGNGKQLSNEIDNPTCEGEYQRRKKEIWMDDREQCMNKIKNQTSQYEKNFKNNFVMKIYELCVEAKDNIKEINKELRKMNFQKEYEFVVDFVNDSSNYKKILDYAKYMKKTNRIDDRYTLESIMEYPEEEWLRLEEDVKEIINDLLQKSNEELDAFVDYRNYMTYEITEDDGISKKKVSRQHGSASGGGAQIPYIIILVVSLTLMFNVRQNSSRLVFMDEPFEKLDNDNSMLMLEFLKSQNLQVIFAAPANRMDTIGEASDVVITVGNKDKRKDQMFAITDFMRKE